MPRNLVVCIDGTSDFAAEQPTHVFRLFRALEISDAQLAYYDGGVGSLAHLSVFGKPRKLPGMLDLAAATSIRRNFESAYSFLVQNYRQGDKVFFFGFSRGAYAVRALAGAIEMFGLLRPEHLNLVGYVWQEYRKYGDIEFKKSQANDHGKNPEKEYTSKRMKRAFSREITIEYLGVWDTVSSVGFLKLITLPFTTHLVNVTWARHAVAIDEKRNMFPENLIARNERHEECWFAGVHRDAGGGGKAPTIALSMFSFDWVLEKALDLDLKLDNDKTATMRNPSPDACAPDNRSFWLVFVYAFAGLVPMKWWNDRRDKYTWKWLNLWHTRRIPDKAWVHHSVFDRQKCPNARYKPKGLNKASATIIKKTGT